MKTSKKVINISANMKELKGTLGLIPPNRSAIAQSLFSELEFMQKTLTILKQQIADEGPTVVLRGILRERPAMKSYNTMIPRYSLLYKQITDLLPPVIHQQQIDPLIDFVKGVEK